MALRVLPDAERLVAMYLRAQLDLDALIMGRVYTQLPADPVFPLVVIHRIGGIPKVRQHLDRARVQVDAWGATKFEARGVAAVAQAALHEMVGSHALGVVTAVDDDLGLTWQPDPETERPRYVFGVAVDIHPLP